MTVESTSPKPAPRVRLGALVCLAGLAWLGTAAGCARLDLASRLPWPGRDNKPAIPSQMSVIWTDTTLNQPGRPSVRGFGGRVMFYGKAGGPPVKVDGRVTVYAFDETDAKSGSAPQKKYVFEPAQLPAHYSESKLGHSYSFWLPWDEVGGPPRQISLMVRFEPVGGPAVVSENSRQLLPGIGEAPESARIASRPNARQNAGAIRQTSYVDDAQEGAWSGGAVDVGPHHLSGTELNSVELGQGPSGAWAERTQRSKPSFETITIDVPDDFARNHLAGSEFDAPAEFTPDGFRRPLLPRDATGQPSNDYYDEHPRTYADDARGRTAPRATAQDSEGGEESSARYEPRPHPVRKAPAPRPRLDRLRKQPFHATWPSPLPETPRSPQTGVWQSPAANAPSTSPQQPQDRAE